MSKQIIHLWAAYVVTWVILGGYSVWLWRKWNSIKQ